jgi:hypothetical protein
LNLSYAIQLGTSNIGFCGTLRREQKLLYSAMGPTGNHYLHEFRWLGVEGFHDPRMLTARFIYVRGNPAPERETQTKLESSLLRETRVS